MEKYCIYLRKSRKDLEAEHYGEGETLARHEQELLYLGKKFHLNIQQIYKEIVSGETISSRPIMQQLLSEVEQGEWSGVLVMEIERLARGDTIDQGIVSQAFKLSGTKIITPIKIYDPNDEFDEEYFEFGLFMSRREFKTINRRIQRGRLESVNEGKYISSTPPYGYDKVKISNGKGYTLKPNANADIVKLIFELYIHGIANDKGIYTPLGATRIARYLDEHNIKSPTDNVWSRTTIINILHNNIYTGKIQWQRRKQVKSSINGQIVKKQKVSNDYILTDGLHEPIIDEKTFKLAQMKSSENKKMPIKPNLTLQNPFTGLMYCALCGKLMTRLGANSHKNYDTIKCSNRYCNNISAPIYMVEKELIFVISNWLDNYKIEISKQDDKISNSYIKTNEKAIESAKNELKTLNKQFNNTYTLLEQGVYTIEVFKERNKIIGEQIDVIKSNIEKFQNEIERNKKLELSKYEIIPKAENLIKTYFNLENAYDKNAILKEILYKIDYVKTVPNKKYQLENANFELIIYPKVPK